MNAQTSSEWLVAIHTKSYYGNRFITTEEVIAESETTALTMAYLQFCNRCQYEPVMRRKMYVEALDVIDCRAVEAITI